MEVRVKVDRFTSQLNYVFRLERYVSQLMSQNALTPYIKGKNNLNFSRGRDQIVHLKTAANLSCLLASNIFSPFVLFLK